MIGSLLVLVALMVALQLVVSRVSLVVDAKKDEIHVHDHDHDHHDHAHHDHAHDDKSGVKSLSADEEAKLKNAGEKHT
jgi:ABC-type nickel/cobalt efflux system permease component RcnA